MGECKNKRRRPIDRYSALKHSAAARLFSHSRQPLRLVFQTAFVAEQTQVPDFNFNYNFFENGTIATRLVDISSAPTSYHLFGLSVETQLFQKLNLSLVGENLFNVDYRNYLNRLRYFAGETGRNIRIELSYLF